MNYDVIISGGGLLGFISAIALSHNSISVALIEKNVLPRIIDDDRAFAISQGSKKILEKLGIWQLIENKAEPILDICVLDVNSPITVHFNYKMVGEEPMGYVVNINSIWSVINENFLNILNIYSPHSYKRIDCNARFVEVVLDDDRKLTASLFICAEGKNYKLPNLFSIPMIIFDYKQSSIVFNVEHELHHQNLAVEKFFPGGPFAILPMKGGYISSIVWTEKSKIVEMLMNLSEEEFIEEFRKRFGSYLGEIKLNNKKKSYPLSFAFAKKLYKDRVLLIGDTSHSIHPVAGQGLNLGIRDIESVVRHIVAAKNFGIDIGSSYLLKRVSRDRYFDNCTVALVTDALNRLFSNRTFCFKTVRNLGLIAVENLTLLKKYFIRYGMGLYE
ncbi:MAG: 2-octaprenyl-6-methoxyphenyl hydroxylase [Wolbachia endosymbiont of Meromenopon meropis]|nr:2-octaprenyl-6-methoxyphenyl hydroxylase [Wolbachia endosymbiont of Meromenopon meropis]